MLPSLTAVLAEAVARRPDHAAVEEPPNFSLTYRELDRLSDAVCAWVGHGVTSGDRVGIYLPKSIDALAAVYGAMKAGAAYVPVDYAAPAWRAAYILHDCGVAVAVLERSLREEFERESTALGRMPATLVLDGIGGGRALSEALLEEGRGVPVAASPPWPDDLAYILYTSGSTGKPKGVMHSHRNAVTFVEWCAETFAPTPDDRFSSHAPFHFDLSILDLYLPARCAGTVLLIDAEAGKEPAGLAALIADRKLTVWYSTPSILSLLVQYGKLDRHDYSTLRLILFAGEVFPVKHLRALTRRIPHPRYFNLYGPTETNVCTFHEIPLPVPDERTTPYPIGKVCSNYAAMVADDAGRAVDRGAEGELRIRGPGVMLGYWNLPEQVRRCFAGDGADRWYRTGDVVAEAAGGVFTYLGRRDRMVKRRGYRIELGDIEAGLYRHPAIREVAVVATPSEESGVRITAFVACHAGRQASVIELKRFSAETLPQSMIPDVFVFRGDLPKTSTDKIDYQALSGAV